MKVFLHNTKEETKKAATETLNQLFGETSQPILFLSSGGSSLELLDGLSLGDHVTVSVLDERYSNDPTINNFSQLMTHRISAKFIDTRIKEGESIQELAQRFEKELREWKNANPNGTIVITQGMGSDGHTAGMMPYPESHPIFQNLFENSHRWVVGYDATKEKNEYPLRVTVTMPFLQEVVDHSIVYLTGENKTEAFKRTLDSQGKLWETPARIIREMKDVKIFTDIVYSTI